MTDQTIPTNNSREYRVIWEIDVDADNPTDAAEKALRIMIDTGRGPDDANVFHVRAHGDDERLRIDLGEPQFE